MKRRLFLVLALAGVTTIGGAYAENAGSDHPVAPSAESAKPLASGSAVPAVDVTREDGSVVKITEALGGKPAAIVFYRGHWCPFCMKHLKALQEIAGELEGLGVGLVGVTPDKPSYVAEAKKKAKLNFPIYSDGELGLARAMGVAFQLDPKTAERYKPYLVESTGHDLGQLPVPAVFLVDKEGTIQFVHSNPDYKVRLSNDDLLAAVKKMQG
jgi:peroxiredoxin